LETANWLTESKSRVCWDAVHLAFAVTQRGGDDQKTLATELHTLEALVPALEQKHEDSRQIQHSRLHTFDHLTSPQPECEL
jgi:hypothetical protein